MKAIPARFSDFKGVTHTISEIGNSSMEESESHFMSIFILCSSALFVFASLYGIFQNHRIKASIIMLKKDVATLSSLNNETKTEKNEPTNSNS